jgi:dTDP-4-dehydrorhamnose reductase
VGYLRAVSRPVVLLTGAAGLVGTWLRRSAPADVELVSLVHRVAIDDSSQISADLRDEESVVAAFHRVQPSIVIHAAMALDEASIIEATSNVVRQAAQHGSDVMYVSTDAVFSGDGHPIDEYKTPDPTYDYGQWKASAERLVLATATSSCVVRLPLVVSLAPLDRVTERIRHGYLVGQPTQWFDDEIRQSAMAADLACGLWRIAALAPDRRSGPWHLPGPERLSRYEIALRTSRALSLPRSSVASVPSPSDTDRPRHLCMTANRAKREIDWDPMPVFG